MAEPTNPPSESVLAATAREVEEFVAAAGWEQPPQLFALVPTETLLREQPGLASQLDAASPLTPIAQEPLPEGDLAQALGTIAWPDAVVGCALAQEIIVLPPSAEQELAEQDDDQLRAAAANHPERTEARLVAAVSRAGQGACVMRLRGSTEPTGQPDEPVDELIERPDLAPNLVSALQATFAP